MESVLTSETRFQVFQRKGDTCRARVAQAVRATGGEGRTFMVVRKEDASASTVGATGALAAAAAAAAERRMDVRCDSVAVWGFPWASPVEGTAAGSRVAETVCTLRGTNE